jgi:predicted DCC family thiol-disulfide oxidoreductase YuxK
MTQTLAPLTLFYDGACPLCQAEILYLASRNQNALLNFIDVNSSAYDPQKIGVSCQEALDRMYGQIEGQEPIHGVADRKSTRLNSSHIACEP